MVSFWARFTAPVQRQESQRPPIPAVQRTCGSARQLKDSRLPGTACGKAREGACLPNAHMATGTLSRLRGGAVTAAAVLAAACAAAYAGVAGAAPQPDVSQPGTRSTS
jgi:hypothetical protein